MAREQLLTFAESHNYETTESNISLRYAIHIGTNLDIKSAGLNASFITKTDPNYLRYISNGTGSIDFNGVKKSAHLFTDTLLSVDSNYAYLKK